MLVDRLQELALEQIAWQLDAYNSLEMKAMGLLAFVGTLMSVVAAFTCGLQPYRTLFFAFMAVSARWPMAGVAVVSGKSSAMSHEVEPVRPHIVLVGVASVGKTTLGAAVAPKVRLPFYDNDLTMERGHGVTIEDLSGKPGNDEIIDDLLWRTYSDVVAATERTLITVSPRLVGRRDFWELTRKRAVSIHLRRTPLEVLRHDVAA